MSVHLCYCSVCQTVFAHEVYGEQQDLFCTACHAKTPHYPLPGLLEAEP